MTFFVADRVQETTNSPGTGTATLLGAVSGYQSFSTGIGANNTTFYVIADQLGTNWEVGLGALNSTGTVLTRTTVYSSSNGGSTVNFATGTQYVWCDFPSSKAVIQGTAVNFSSIGATTAGTGAFTTLSASSTVSGAGFSNYFAAPPTIGNTTPNAGTFTALVATSITDSGLTAGRVNYNGVGGLLTDSANMTFNGTTLTLANDASISGLTVGKGGGAVSTNTAVGVSALTSNTSGASNQAFGSGALSSNTSGNYNSAFAQQSLGSNSTGGSNSAFGYQALVNNTTANYNTALGSQALFSNTTSTGNTAVGSGALYGQTTASGDGGNTAVGYNSQSLGNNYRNTSVGYNTLQNSTGSANNAFGYGANSAVNTGSNNNSFGYLSLATNTSGGSNTAYGHQTLFNNTSASNNTAVGYQAGYAITTSANNVCLGSQAGANISNGVGYNVCLGYGTGGILAAGQANIYIGYQAVASSAGSGHNNELVIATNGATGKGINTGFIYCNGGGIYQSNNSATWSITSDQRLKKNIVDNTVGLSAISQIQVRNFEYRTADEVTELEPQNAINIKGVQLGAIAQELQAILPDCVKTESTGVMSVDTTNLTWYLINAVKELKAEIDLLKGK